MICVQTIIAILLMPAQFCTSRIRFKYSGLDVLQHSRTSMRPCPLLKTISNVLAKSLSKIQKIWRMSQVARKVDEKLDYFADLPKSILGFMGKYFHFFRSAGCLTVNLVLNLFLKKLVLSHFDFLDDLLLGFEHCNHRRWRAQFLSVLAGGTSADFQAEFAGFKSQLTVIVVI